MKSSSSLKFATLIIPAGSAAGNTFNPGTVKVSDSGAFLYIKTATTPFLMQLDANSLFQVEGGFKFTENYQTVTFINPNTWPITIGYYVGTVGVEYVGTNQVKDALTYNVGNFGLTASGVYNNQAITISAAQATNNCIQIGAAPIKITNLNSGHQRRSIVLTNVALPGAPAAYTLFDANGCAMFNSTNNGGSALFMDSDLMSISNGGGANNAWVQIKETYYAN